MSGTWTILQSSKTSDTAYTIAQLVADGGGEQTLTIPQADPLIDPPTPNATTAPFNTEGYGNGVTISYLVSIGTNIEAILDINNDNSGISTSEISITTNVTSVTFAATVTIAQSSTSGAGTGATFTLTSAAVGGIITSAVGSGTSGQGYVVGDTVTFTAAALGGTAFGATVGDLVLTLGFNNLSAANPSWIATVATNTTGVGGFFLAAKEAFHYVRLRMVSAGTITEFRIMADS